MPLVFMWFMLVKRAKKNIQEFIGNIGIRILHHKVLIQKY